MTLLAPLSFVAVAGKAAVGWLQFRLCSFSPPRRPPRNNVSPVPEWCRHYLRRQTDQTKQKWRPTM